MKSIWSSAPIGELCEVYAGGTPSRSCSEYWDGGVPWVKISDMLQGTINKTEEQISQAGLNGSTAKLLPVGTLLISIFATIGRTAVLGIEAATNQAIVGLVLKDTTRLNPHFLRYVLEFKSMELAQQARGVAQANINSSILKSLQIFLPPIEEQRRIAEILDRAQAVRSKRRAALAQLDALIQAIFIDLFADPITNPKGWPVFRLGELIADGPQNGLYKPASDYGSGTPILRIDAFYDGKVTKLSALKRVRISEEERSLYRLHPGNIVINRVNSMAYLGKSALIPDLAELTVFESNMMRFDVNRARIETGYIIQFLQTSFIKGQIQNAAKNAVNQSSINQQDVRSFQINVPPIPLQREFTRRVAAVEKLKVTHLASLAEMDAFFASLQHRAFRGEL